MPASRAKNVSMAPWPIAQLLKSNPKQMRLGREDQPPAHDHHQRNGDDAQHFGHRMAQRVVAGDAHGLVIVALVVVVEPLAFLRLVGEGLDDLDAAEGFFEGGVDDGHFLHRPAIRPLEHLRQPADREGRRGGDDQGEQQQPPAKPGRQSQAGEHLQRLADQLAEQRIQAAGHLAHVVGEAAHQIGRAVLAEGGQIHPQRAAIEELPQVEDGPLRQPRHQHVVEPPETRP